MVRDLTGSVIAITGASSGIGAATAIACAEAGMDVALAARREDRMYEIAGRIEGLGRRSLVVLCDVDRDEDVHQFIDRTLHEFARLDVVFANAGYGLRASIMDTTDEQARMIFETNFFGSLRLIRACVPVMREKGRGHILICSSVVSEIGLPMHGMYSATKAAQDAIAGSLRAELAVEGLNVSSVHPVGTRTEFFEKMRRRGARTHDRKTNTPSTMMQSPQKVARSIVRCLRRPKPEVWPQPLARLGLALTTAWPTLSAMSMRYMMRRQ